MKPEELVLTVIARDRPGLIKAISETIARHDGNWIDSSMARLSGEFAGILRVAVPSACLAPLETALGRLGDAGIWVTIRKAEQQAEAHRGRHVRLEMTGVDHPGIIHEISAALAGLDISIDELETRVFAGSMSGEAMFEAKADIVLPESLDEGQLRERLEDIANDMMVDLTLGNSAA
ncbi:MAG: glycine cleavage system protein R [Hyphomicrobiaceae bacterium]